MDDVDYFVVLAYDNQYCFDTFACLKLLHRSIFTLVISCVQVRSFFLLSVMPMTDVSGRSKPTRVEHHTGIHRIRAPMDGCLFY
jgi:hypothetical protein